MATTKKETPVEQGNVTTPEAPVTEKKDTSKKVYKFKSANKFLSCVALGVQFMNGEATTENLEVAKELVKIDGVELVEQ